MPDASNQELVSAITGAADNSVSRRAARRQAQTDQAQTPEVQPMTKSVENGSAGAACSTAATSACDMHERDRRRDPRLLDRVRSGDLGSLPVVVGLVIIWTVFQSLNPVFLSPNNLVNLLSTARRSASSRSASSAS